MDEAVVGKVKLTNLLRLEYDEINDFVKCKKIKLTNLLKCDTIKLTKLLK